LNELFAQARASIAAIAAIGDGSIRDAIRQLSEKVEQLATDAATEAGNAFQRREFIKVQLDTSFAAIEQEMIARVTATEALAAINTALAARLTTAEGTITGTSAALTSLSTTVTQQGNAITSQSSAITNLSSRLTTAEGDISGNATAVNNLSTTVTQQGNMINAQASQISALNTTVGNNSATLTQVSNSVNGVRVEFGVTGNINGQTGGFRFSGVKRLDGTVSYGVEIVGNLMVDGSISGLKLQTASIITASAQIGNLIVDNISIKNGAISNSASVLTGGTSGSTGLNCRGTGTVACHAVFYGASGNYVPLFVSPGALRIFRNGSLIAEIGTSFEASGSGTSAGIALQATPLLFLDTPPAGFNVYSVDNTNGAGRGGIALVVTELSK